MNSVRSAGNVDESDPTFANVSDTARSPDLNPRTGSDAFGQGNLAASPNGRTEKGNATLTAMTEKVARAVQRRPAAPVQNKG